MLSSPHFYPGRPTGKNNSTFFRFVCRPITLSRGKKAGFDGINSTEMWFIIAFCIPLTIRICQLDLTSNEDRLMKMISSFKMPYQRRPKMHCPVLDFSRHLYCFPLMLATRYVFWLTATRAKLEFHSNEPLFLAQCKRIYKRLPWEHFLVKLPTKAE